MGPDVIVPCFLFGMPVAIVGIRHYFKFKMAQLERGRGGGADGRELEALREERKQLEARVQNLESIVCSVDLELNTRLNRLAAQQSSIGALAPKGPPTAAAAGPLACGQRIAGRFSIERELGRGGMGTVYLARDEQLGERVALKAIAGAVSGDPAAADRFRREVSSARKVTHPNVIRIYDLVEDAPLVLLSMEFVDGTTLAHHLARVGPLSLDEARHLIGQLCDGLGAAHAAGVVHRDLKPANVLLDTEKRLKIIDFGLASASFLAGMTATGLILGTPEYMAPEQVRGLPSTPRTDLYALGALAYQMLTGRPPFTGETPIAVGFQHVSDAPPPPRQLRPELPVAVEAALLRALEKDPARRFADAAEMKRTLCG